MNPPTPPLRVGLLLDSFSQPEWIVRIIDEIASSDFARITLVVRNRGNPVPPPANFADKLRRYARGFLYSNYERWEMRRYRVERDPFTASDVESRLAGVPVLDILPRMTRFADYFDDTDVEAILAHDLDVALRFGFRILKGKSLLIARHGVWSYHHGDNLVNRGGPPGFWEVVERHPVTGSILQILTEELDNGRAIARTWTATHPTSVRMNRAQYYNASSSMAARKLRDLHRKGPAALEDPLGSAFRPYAQRLYRQPNNVEMAGALARVGRQLLTRKVRQRTTHEQWQLAYKLKPEGRGTPDVPDASFYNYKPVIPPKDRFWADPFPVFRDGVYHVFLEEYIYERGRGHISVQEFGPNGPVDEPRPVLVRESHLSFPNVFPIGDDLYMLPESLDVARVELLGCVNYPDRWETAAVLLEDIAAADPIIAQRDGRWWLFLTADGGTGVSWDELMIYHADTPFGPWEPHALNPVKSDVRCSRSAGRLFHLDGRSYRPAQNGAPSYGSGITINEIMRIDAEHFEEREVSTIFPDWSADLTGIHTINAAGRLSVVDLRRRLPRWR
ncbi:MAG: glucosamine inositolphosphorylceramide transferase family protein [Longimicrobiales bacterium]